MSDAGLPDIVRDIARVPADVVAQAAGVLEDGASL